MADCRFANPPAVGATRFSTIAQCVNNRIFTLGGMMAFVKLLAVLPFLGILVGVPLLNQVEPLVLGMPLILAWIVLWVVLTAVIMLLVYWCDPANRARGESRP
jgi:hypothetical protein